MSAPPGPARGVVEEKGAGVGLGRLTLKVSPWRRAGGPGPLEGPPAPVRCGLELGTLETGPSQPPGGVGARVAAWGQEQWDLRLVRPLSREEGGRLIV